MANDVIERETHLDEQEFSQEEIDAHEEIFKLAKKFRNFSTDQAEDTSRFK